MDKFEIILRRELYRRSFYDFVKDFWNEADPSKFVDGKLIQYYCEVFQYKCRQWTNEQYDFETPKFKKGDIVVDIRGDKKNVCINVPPRHSKSMIFNVLGPVWLWTLYPIKGVSVSHTSGLSKTMNKKRQSVINSLKFKEIFPQIKLETDSATSLIDTRKGELYSVCRNAFTGYGGDIIINDDLTNAETAKKDMEEMANAWSYYQTTMPSRINDINKCIIMNIQQRLAPNDITGHILADKKLRNRYDFIVLPSEFKQTTHYICPISGTVITFKKGDYLWPERFGDYSGIKAEVGETIYETQYLQNPIASDRTVIKEDMIVEVDACDCPSIDDCDIIYASHDFPVKDKESSDFLGSVLAYKVGATIYVTDCLEKKMAFVKSVKYVEDLENVYRGIIQIIEDKANGSPILQQLQDKVPGLQAYQPGTQSKMQRLESASLYMPNVRFVRNVYDKVNNCYRLSDALENLKQKLLNFPFVEHDDIVDAFSQLVLFTFMDRRFMVYGRSFNGYNIQDLQDKTTKYSTVFFNKEGDMWKACEIYIDYGAETKLYVKKEFSFKSDPYDAISTLREHFNKKVFIDCSSSEAMYGVSMKGASIERYSVEDFDTSVNQLSLAFAKNRIIIDKNCKRIINDIENFKFNKTKDETVKYLTEKDGYCACLRISLRYFGGIV